MEWMMMPLKRYADFSGRSRRKEYWMFALFQVIVYVVLGTICIAGLPSGNEEPGALFWLGFSLLGLFALATFIPSIAVAVRRFHDQDKSGWMYLLAFIPSIGGIILIVFMCLEGTRGENQYGADPLDPSQADVFA